VGTTAKESQRVGGAVALEDIKHVREENRRGKRGGAVVMAVAQLGSAVMARAVARVR
jgi:hypothetical protein